MRHATLLLPVLAAPALWAATRPADSISFHPTEGLSLVRTFTEKSDTTLENMIISMNGEEIDPAMMGGQPSITISHTTTRVVADTFVKLGDGRPLTLKRTFDTLGSAGSMAMEAAMMGNQDMELSGSSELEGKTVVFHWNPDGSDYRVSYPEGEEGDEDLLEGLTEDMDLRQLLPSGEVSVDDSWEIDLDAVLSVLAPGGDLKILPTDMEEMTGGMMGPGQGPGGDISQMLGALEGTATGTYAGKREVDGITVASIRVAFDVSSARDMTDDVREMMENIELPEEAGEAEIDVGSVDVEFEFDGEGLLLWNIEGGYLHSFELSGETYMAMDMAMTMTMPGMGTMEQEIGQEFAGTTNITVKVASR